MAWPLILMSFATQRNSCLVICDARKRMSCVETTSRQNLILAYNLTRMTLAQNRGQERDEHRAPTNQSHSSGVIRQTHFVSYSWSYITKSNKGQQTGSCGKCIPIISSCCRRTFFFEQLIFFAQLAVTFHTQGSKLAKRKAQEIIPAVGG